MKKSILIIFLSLIGLQVQSRDLISKSNNFKSTNNESVAFHLNNSILAPIDPPLTIMTVLAGTDFIMASGTVVGLENLILTPSTDYTITDFTLTRNKALTNTTGITSINKAYSFSKTLPAYTGEVKINYFTSELNGLSESTLKILDFNGTDWYINNGGLNYNNTGLQYVSTTFTAKPLNELSLATACTGFVWSGANGSIDWENANNWSCKIKPNFLSDVVIQSGITVEQPLPYQPKLTNNISINSLTINSGSLIVPSGLNLTVSNKITNNGTMTVENNANLIQTDNVQNEGEITVIRNSNKLFRLDYSMWSSPVTSSTKSIKDFSPLTDPTRFYQYVTLSSQYIYIVNPALATFTKGEGYLIRMPIKTKVYTLSDYSLGLGETFIGSFTGVPNNGSFTHPMSILGNKYNAVGNPYPSTLNVDAFLTANTANIEGTLWFWRKRNDAKNLTSYTTCTSAGIATLENGALYPDDKFISVGQGFIVKAKTIDLFFNNTMRAANNTNQFFRTKSTERNRIWLNLSNATQPINQMMVAYMTGASKDIDRADGRYINDNKTALNTLINNEEFAIQGRNLPFDPADVVPMSFKTDIAGAYTIAIDHVDGLFSNNQQIILKDNNTGVETDLKSGPYNFTASVGIDNTRFSLLYQKNLGVNSSDFNAINVNVFKNKGNIIIKSESRIIDNVKLYDINGRLIFEKLNVNANETAIESTKYGNQILVVKITSDENKVMSVKIVN